MKIHCHPSIQKSMEDRGSVRHLGLALFAYIIYLNLTFLIPLRKSLLVLYLFRFLFGDQWRGSTLQCESFLPPERNSILDILAAGYECIYRTFHLLREQYSSGEELFWKYFILPRKKREPWRTYHFLVRQGSVLILIRDSSSVPSNIPNITHRTQGAH